MNNFEGIYSDITESIRVYVVQDLNDKVVGVYLNREQALRKAFTVNGFFSPFPIITDNEQVS